MEKKFGKLSIKASLISIIGLFFSIGVYYIFRGTVPQLGEIAILLMLIFFAVPFYVISIGGLLLLKRFLFKNKRIELTLENIICGIGGGLVVVLLIEPDKLNSVIDNTNWLTAGAGIIMKSVVFVVAICLVLIPVGTMKWAIKEINADVSREDKNGEKRG